jgi:hypothetical protein
MLETYVLKVLSNRWAASPHLILSLSLTKHHATKRCWGVNVELQAFLFSSPDGGELPVLGSGERVSRPNWLDWVGPRPVWALRKTVKSLLLQEILTVRTFLCLIHCLIIVANWSVERRRPRISAPPANIVCTAVFQKARPGLSLDKRTPWREGNCLEL